MGQLTSLTVSTSLRRDEPVEAIAGSVERRSSVRGARRSMGRARWRKDRSRRWRRVAMADAPGSSSREFSIPTGVRSSASARGPAANRPSCASASRRFAHRAHLLGALDRRVAIAAAAASTPRGDQGQGTLERHDRGRTTEPTATPAPRRARLRHRRAHHRARFQEETACLREREAEEAVVLALHPLGPAKKSLAP